MAVELIRLLDERLNVDRGSPLRLTAAARTIATRATTPEPAASRSDAFTRFEAKARPGGVPSGGLGAVRKARAMTP